MSDEYRNAIKRAGEVLRSFSRVLPDPPKPPETKWVRKEFTATQDGHVQFPDSEKTIFMTTGQTHKYRVKENLEKPMTTKCSGWMAADKEPVVDKCKDLTNKARLEDRVSELIKANDSLEYDLGRERAVNDKQKLIIQDLRSDLSASEKSFESLLAANQKQAKMIMEAEEKNNSLNEKLKWACVAHDVLREVMLESLRSPKAAHSSSDKPREP